jgi:hypothetical protein
MIVKQFFELCLSGQATVKPYVFKMLELSLTMTKVVLEEFCCFWLSLRLVKALIIGSTRKEYGNG